MGACVIMKLGTMSEDKDQEASSRALWWNAEFCIPWTWGLWVKGLATLLPLQVY